MIRNSENSAILTIQLKTPREWVCHWIEKTSNKLFSCAECVKRCL